MIKKGSPCIVRLLTTARNQIITVSTKRHFYTIIVPRGQTCAYTIIIQSSLPWPGRAGCSEKSFSQSDSARLGKRPNGARVTYLLGSHAQLNAISLYHFDSAALLLYYFTSDLFITCVMYNCWTLDTQELYNIILYRVTTKTECAEKVKLLRAFANLQQLKNCSSQEFMIQ